LEQRNLVIIRVYVCITYEGDYNIQDKKLAVGAMISEEMRAAVYEETGFRCSAGIAHNKVCCYIFLSFFLCSLLVT
jgi:nucleotidyltransferase/DNA polymerase involved in DNA repair